jgi:hypothetical protein
MLLPGGKMAAAAKGYLLAIRDGVLMAYPFDEARLKFRGEGRPIRFAEQVRSFSVSGNTLAYRGPEIQAQLTWFDRHGKALGTVGEPAQGGPLSISPDGRKVILVRGPGVWLLDLERGTSMRFTFTGGRPTSAVWSPDGARIAFGVQQAGGSSILMKHVNGAGAGETMFRADQSLAVDSWSPDGRLILYEELDASGKSGIWQLPLQSDRKPAAVLRSDFVVRSGRLSPDQRWMAYVSNETGRDEVYVQSFPGPSGKWMISSTGGTEPCWRRDAKELFFLSADRILMSVQIAGSSRGFDASIPRPLFPTRRGQWYAPAGDGGRFLVPMTPKDAEPPSIDVVLNWTQDLRR